MLHQFISAFITLFVVLDPPGCAPIYAGLTAGATAAQRRTMAIRATVIALFAQGVPAVHRSDRAPDFLACLDRVDTTRQATAQDVREIYSKGLAP